MHFKILCNSVIFFRQPVKKDPATPVLLSYITQSRSHSPLCFLLLGPLTPSLTFLKAFRASSSSFRNMALVSLRMVLLKTHWTSTPAPNNVSSLHIRPWEWLPLRREMRTLTSKDHPRLPPLVFRPVPKLWLPTPAFYFQACIVQPLRLHYTLPLHPLSPPQL